MTRLAYMLCAVSLLLGSGSAMADLAAELQQAADAVNQQTPMMLDAETRLDKASTGNKQFKYHYSLINYTAAELDSEKFKAALRPTLIQTSCTQLKPFFDRGVSVVYMYNDKNGKNVASLTLTGKDCGK